MSPRSWLVPFLVLTAIVAEKQHSHADDALPPGAMKRIGSRAFKWNGNIVDVSSDGKRLLAIEHTGDSLALIDSNTGTIQRRESARNSDFQWARFTGNGKRIVIKTDDQLETRGLTDWSVFRTEKLEEGLRQRILLPSEGGKFLVEMRTEGETYSIALFGTEGIKPIQTHPTSAWLNETVYAFSPDDALIAIRTPDKKGSDHVAEPDGWVEIHDLKLKRVVTKIRTDIGKMASMTFSPDGKKLVACGMLSVQVWDVASGKMERSWAESITGKTFATFSPDGKSLYLATRGVVKNWNFKTGERGKARWFRHTIDTVDWDGIRWLDDGRLIGWRMHCRAIELWNLSDGKRLNTTEGHLRPVDAMSFNPSGQLISSSYQQAPLVWAIPSGKSLGPLALPDDGSPSPPWSQTRPVSFSSSGRYMFFPVAYPTGLSIPPFVGNSLWDIEGKRCIAHDWVHGNAGSERERAFSPDDRHVAVIEQSPLNRRSQILAFDLKTGKPIRGMKLRHHSSSIAFSVSGRILAATDDDERKAWLVGWEIPSGLQRFRHLLPFNRPYAMTFLDDQRILLIDLDHADRKPDSALMMLDIRTGNRLDWKAERIEPDRQDAPIPLVSPDRRLIAVSTKTGVSIIEVASGSVRHTFTLDQPVHSFAFDRDSRILATAMPDTTILTWDLSQPSTSPTAGPSELWNRLGDPNAKVAWAAIRESLAKPEMAMQAFREKLKTTPNRPRIQTDQLPGLIALLDSTKFAEREHATSELIRAGEMALPAVKKAIAANPTAEALKRLESIREKLQTPYSLARWLPDLRAIEVLERIGSNAAIEQLNALARGGDSPATSAATEALRRLAADKATTPQSPK